MLDDWFSVSSLLKDQCLTFDWYFNHVQKKRVLVFVNPGDWRKVPSILVSFRCIFVGYELQILMCLNVFWVLCSSDHIWLSFQDTQSFFHPNIDVYLLLCALVKKWNEAAAIRTKFPCGFVWGLSKRILHFARGFACEWLDSYQISFSRTCLQQ